MEVSANWKVFLFSTWNYVNNKGMNSLILDFLDSYADNPNPQYAVMLKGKWGCGKTHLIKQR